MCLSHVAEPNALENKTKRRDGDGLKISGQLGRDRRKKRGGRGRRPKNIRRIGMGWQRGEGKRENAAKRRGGWTAARVEGAPPSFVGRTARFGLNFGGQKCDRRSFQSPLK